MRVCVCVSFHFFLESGSVRSRMRLAPGLSPVHMEGNMGGKHESVVLTWRQARIAHTAYPFIPFIMIENKSPVLLLS